MGMFYDGVEYGSEGGWEYDPEYDEYYRPDGDYSGGEVYPGGGGSDPYGIYGNLPMTGGYGGISQAYNPYYTWPGQFDSPNPTFSTDVFGSNPSGDPAGRNPIRNPFPPVPPIQDPTGPGRGGAGGQGQQQQQGSGPPLSFSMNNTAVNASNSNIPTVSQGVPEGNDQQFTPQRIGPRSQPDGGGPEMDYDYGLESEIEYDPYPSSPSTSPIGGGKPAASERGGFGAAAMDVFKGVTGLDISSPRALGESALGMTGVNRYRKLIQDVRKRPKQQQQQKNQYGI